MSPCAPGAIVNTTGCGDAFVAAAADGYLRGLGTMDCARRGGTAPCVMSAANEVAVHKFLRHELGYNRIYDAAAEAVEQARRALLDEVLKHAVGGRLFYYAEAQDDGCHVLVQETFWDGEDEPVSRIMDADGRFADHPSTGSGTVGE